ncbi:hypothetical protein SECTIM467_83 [Brevibacillus phage SecTim467]|uniref:Deoxynucleoside monophosphate kinase n=2 Tax=Jenstvirus jenst TaxID=1982225 RepID=A0A0K2CNN0_9CAUD|nr:putative deoxynucleoside monophosphate kinase [Brevibacillus phage Jenst]ALA07207.1 putative deoxynucleoside monophosphate kinase [Brevibacillus phage Jenst]ALA07427.1 hypothetical protein SECTIM467_83 [Brevibacillus phage SecTim467]
MKKSGYIVRNGKGEHIYVFSQITNNNKYPTHVGYNLTTLQVGEYQQTAPMLSVDLSEIPEDEQLVVGTMIAVRNALAKGTVAITAKARSGKDHIADVIRMQFLTSSIIRPLAEPIYEIARAISGGVKGKNRELLIMVGQGLREKDPNIWIKTWLRRNIESFLKGRTEKFICQDLRQPNEYSFFRNLGATIVGISPDEEKRLAKIAELDGYADLNEKLLKDETERNAGTYEVDYVLVNNYDDKFDSDIRRFIGEVLVAKKGW